jgi:ABC-type transport system involved in cytochrome c biogenesis permease subunit
VERSGRPEAGPIKTNLRAPGGAARAARAVAYGNGLRTLSISTVLAMAVALGLVFFYAPLEAEQGFLQKIFYVHVPLATVAL